MAGRLTLDRTGIKGPLDIAPSAPAARADMGRTAEPSRSPSAPRIADPPVEAGAPVERGADDATRESEAEGGAVRADGQSAVGAATPPKAAMSFEQTSGRRTEEMSAASARTSPRTVAASRPAPSPARMGGRARQTSIALDADTLARLRDLALSASVPMSALAVAALEAGMPVEGEDACRLAVRERAERHQRPSGRVECNLRIPDGIRAHLQDLARVARAIAPRVVRADVVNVALRRGLPADPQAASELVAAYRRRLELEPLRNV